MAKTATYDVQAGQALATESANKRDASRTKPSNIQREMGEGLRRATQRNNTAKIESKASAYVTQRGMMDAQEASYDRMKNSPKPKAVAAGKSNGSFKGGGARSTMSAAMKIK